jgi:glycosyltransferase involved in cell wall biosynthesis
MSTIRVLTCTPVAFRGDHTFFARESGLLSRGLRMAGVQSFAVMPAPAQDGDEEGLVRASVEQLKDASWWRRHSADAVVFYAWAMPEYAPISKAIKASGTKLMLYLDASGLWNSWSDGTDWFRAYWIFNLRTHGPLWGSTRFLLGALRQSIPATLAKPRLKHMALADVIGSGSPSALARTKHYAETFGFSDITDRMVLSPPPIPVHFRYEGEQKKKRIICVARWLKPDWAQKNPSMLLASLELFLSRRHDYEAVVVGRGANDLRSSKFYPAGLNDLPVRFIDAIPNAELTALYQESRISFCSSYHESFHLASFEAACCGCSIVALDSPDLPALQWLAESDGTLANEDSPQSFAEALLAEAAKWDGGGHSGEDISHRWSSELHADKAAARVLRQLGLRS